MLQELLKRRELPNLIFGMGTDCWDKRRKKLLKLLGEYVYGHTPEFQTELYSYIESRDETACGGMAICEWVRLSFQTPRGMYSFPFQLITPKQEGVYPTFLHIAFQMREQNSFCLGGIHEGMPLEEVLASGYAVANLYYEDVTSDSPNVDGLARAYEGGERNSWGKIGMWAFAASRVMDYLITRKEIDEKRVAVSGWSRLGKTALWCGAQDERFALVISTESGCGGAALQRGKKGERIRQITERFPYWFCPGYAEYAERETELPVDQHFLLACVAPRALFVGSAAEDGWADPVSEFLGVVAASKAYERLGEVGVVHRDRLPETGEKMFEGKIGYMLRPGCHGMSLTDWRAHIEFWKRIERC